LLQDVLAGQQILFVAQLNLLVDQPNTNQTRNEPPYKTALKGVEAGYLVAENVSRHRRPPRPAGARTEKKTHAQD